MLLVSAFFLLNMQIMRKIDVTKFGYYNASGLCLFSAQHADYEEDRCNEIWILQTDSWPYIICFSWANSPYFILALPIVAMFGITACAFETLIPSENEIKVVLSVLLMYCLFVFDN